MSNYEHLLGQEFVFGKSDCYSIIRDFYKDNYNIILPNYARPTNFWEHGMNMYVDRFHKLGFKVLSCHPSDYQYGDIFLMSIQSSLVNHAGILIEKGMMLHHLVGQISTVTRYGGMWRNNTMAVIRHKDVSDQSVSETVNLLDHVPEHIRRKVNDSFEQNKEASSSEV